MKGRLLAAGLAVLGLAGSLPHPALSDAVVVPYGSCGWKYFAPPGSYNPIAMSDVGYDDSAWTDGCAPFVAPWGCGPPGTMMPLNTQYAVRRHIFNAGPETVAHYNIKPRGFVAAYWSNHEGNSGNYPQECPPFYVLSGAFTLSHGDNVVLVRSGAFENMELGGYFDVEVRADAFTPTKGNTWGELKLIYR